MLKINKVSIKLVDQQNEVGNTKLDFKIFGPNIDYIVMNTIRRTIFSDIPIYAFNEFQFEKNSSVFHNNYIKLRLRQLPIWGLENTIDMIDPKNNLNNLQETDKVKNNDNDDNDDNDDDVDLEGDKNLNSSTLKQLTIYINIKNQSTNIKTVSTADAKFYFGETQITSPYPVPIPIVKLQPNQEVAFSAITKIGMEKEDVMFGAACVAYYKQIGDNNSNDFIFCLESRGQITEKRILNVAIFNIQLKIKNFLKLIQTDVDDTVNKFDNNKLEGIIIVNNEDHTLGNLISRGLQQHSAISFAGYNLPHPLTKKVIFHYKLFKIGDIKYIIKEVCNYYSELFDQINKTITSQL